MGESLTEARIPTFKKSDRVKDGHKFTVELFKDLNSEPEYKRFDSEEEARKFADKAANSGEYHSLQIMNSDSVGGGWCIDNWSKAKGWNSTLNEDRKTDIESTLLDGEPDFAEYMRDTYGIDIYDDEIADNPDVEDYYLSDYENYLDHLYDLDNDSYDADHAAEWMERNPYGYYNNEGDYGIEPGEDTDVDPEQFLSSYELRRDMTPEEAEAQIKKVFDDDLANGMIGQEDYDRGTKEVYDYWQKLHTTNEGLTEAVNSNLTDKEILDKCFIDTVTGSGPRIRIKVPYKMLTAYNVNLILDTFSNWIEEVLGNTVQNKSVTIDKSFIYNICRFTSNLTNNGVYIDLPINWRKYSALSADEKNYFCEAIYSFVNDEFKFSLPTNEALTEDNNIKKFEIRKEYIDDVLENNGNAPIDAILNPDYYYVNIIDVGDKYILEGDETNVYNMLVPFDLQWRIYPIDESLTEAAKKDYRAELYYFDSQNPDDTVYFPSLKDAYKFCNRESEDSDLTGLTGIIIYHNSTDKKINTWQNGSRGWEKKVNGALNEAQFSKANSNDDIRLVKASYDHFMNDLDEIPSPDDILYDILDNYNQDIFQEGGPMIEGKEIEAIKYILRSQGLEYRGDLDESKNDTLNQDI